MLDCEGVAANLMISFCLVNSPATSDIGWGITFSGTECRASDFDHR